MKDYIDNIDDNFNAVAGKIIKKYREENKMSLEEVVNKMKNPVSRQSLYKYENNLARMKVSIFKDVCNALGIDSNDVWKEINSTTLYVNLKSIDNRFSSTNKEVLKQIEPADKNNYNDLIKKINNITFDNATPIEMDSDTIMIPVLGTIKAGTPIEAQEDILEYVDIPRSWTRGGKKFYGLFISGDSMYPKYNEKDIVIFEQNEDMELANGKDCAVMVNGDDVTFKRFNLRGNGITLTPLNLDNEDGYLPTSYDAQEVFDLPIKVIGVARRKISDIEY